MTDSETAPLIRLPDSGLLEEIPLPRLLLTLYETGFTGRLELSRSRTRKAFLLQEGAPVDSESNLSTERLAAILENFGIVSGTDRNAVDTYVKQKRCQEGVALLSLELIEPKQLFAGLREQVRRRMIDCFGWRDGRYELTPSEERKPAIQPFRLDPYRLVQEGLQNHWSLERMLQDLAPSFDRIANGSSRLRKLAKRLRLDASVETLLSGLDGRQLLATALGTAVNSPSAVAAFWVLDAAGALEYSDVFYDPETEATAPEIEIHIRRPKQATANQTTVSPGVEPPRARRDRTDNAPEAEKMRAEVLSRLDHLDSLDFYELLGVAPHAERGAIRKAYLVAAKRYHPDAIARLGLQELRSQTGEVFSKIAEANEVLTNAEQRAAYDHSLERGGNGIDVALLAQAETCYRKGEILIRMGDFRSALEYMKNAVQLYPDEAIYQSDLAWCYYKKSPPDRLPALEHIQKALALNPTDAVAQFRKSLIERNN